MYGGSIYGDSLWETIGVVPVGASLCSAPFVLFEHRQTGQNVYSDRGRVYAKIPGCIVIEGNNGGIPTMVNCRNILQYSIR